MAGEGQGQEQAQSMQPVKPASSQHASSPRKLFLLSAETPIPCPPKWSTRTRAGNHPQPQDVFIGGERMLDVACSLAQLAVARKKQILGQPVTRGMVGKYSIGLKQLHYPSPSGEVRDNGPFEILENHQNFVWREQQGGHAVPRLAVEVGYAEPDPQHFSDDEQPLYAAVARLGQWGGLVPGNVTQAGHCQVSWGGRVYAPGQFWVMCWPDVVPIIQDGLILRKLISTAAHEMEQTESAAVSHGQAAKQVPSHLQPSICSLDDDVVHIIMGHLAGKPWADIVRRIWDDKPTTREEIAGICVPAGIPTELCKVW